MAGRFRAFDHRLHSETVLLASVPLNDEGWEPLAEGEALALRDGRGLFRKHTGSQAPEPISPVGS